MTADWRAIPAHDSFGHDVETAFLLVEAAAALAMPDDEKTWRVAPALVDHALDWGWDDEFGGFYDKGESFAGAAFDRKKVWWTEAEGLNALLLMHRKYGDRNDRYWKAFLKQWDFIEKHLLDAVHGGWYSETTREGKLLGDGAKANQWKANYHTSRALMNVARMLGAGGARAALTGPASLAQYRVLGISLRRINMRGAGLAMVAVGLLLGAGQPKQPEAKDPAEQLQGGWHMVMLLASGEETPAQETKGGELVVLDDVYRSKLGATAEASTFKIDATQSPKAIDFTFTSGFSKGKTIKGIYKIEGDDLTICRGLSPETARPEQFAAPVDSDLVLVVWKRSKTVGVERLKAMQDELKRFEATWKFVSIEFEGNAVPAEKFQDDRLVLKGKQFDFDGAGKHHARHVQDRPDGEAQDDRHHDSPTGRARTIHSEGIYELDGDTQKICWAAPGKPRPTEFEAKPKSGRMLQVLEKVKP